MSSKTIKMKRKPTPPKRSTHRVERRIYCESLAEIIANLPDGVPYEKVKIETDGDSPIIIYEHLEDEGLYKNRVAAYKNRLAEWNKWREENADFVKEWEATRSAIEEQQRDLKISKIEKEIARLEKLRKEI